MKQYVVDAFTDRVFGGNPAAVCIMEQWLPEETMMSITKENNLSEIRFATLSGELGVIRRGDLFELDFPAYELIKSEVTDKMKNAAGTDIEEAYIGRDLMFVLKSEDEVRNFKPDFQKISELEGLLLHVTAAGSEHDCVSGLRKRRYALLHNGWRKN